MNDFILLETLILPINKDEHLSDAFARENYPCNSIPTNCILDKTLPGLGATYSEIIAKRNSIIIEPNIPVITGKAENNDKILGVYEKCTKKTIKKYLLNKEVKYKKILCTPESYLKVKEIASTNQIDLYEDYFMLFDECEKITQDIDYRENISLPLKDFFSHKNKAFVSATPLDTRNPNFKEQGFYKLKVEPQYDYKKDLTLITTNSYNETVIKRLKELKDSECICVFMNSTNGINKLINHLRKQGITDYKAFCSRKSVTKCIKREIYQSYENLHLPLAKYNFFTSRFFSAVDINIDKKPDIIIVTDLCAAKYTRIDPFTNAIQIYGRFRKTFPDGKTFNSLTHIADYNEEDKAYTDNEIESYISQSKKDYDNNKENYTKGTDKGTKAAIHDASKNLPYQKFIDDDEAINYFKVDNFYNDERVKRYYTSPDELLNAYENTKHFSITHTNETHEFNDKWSLQYKDVKSEIDKRRFWISIMKNLSPSKKQLSFDDWEYLKNDLLIEEKGKMVEDFELIEKAYKECGMEALEKTDGKLTEIKKLFKEHKKASDREKMFTKPVKDAIIEKFPEANIYDSEDLFNGFTEIFSRFGITTIKSNIKTIRRYYGADPLKGKNTKGNIRLRKFIPDNKYDD